MHSQTSSRRINTPVTALYVLRSYQDEPVAKVGIVRTPYEDLPTVLRRVRARVRAAIPGGQPLRMRDLPPTDVWVTLSSIPRLLREVESYVATRLGSPRHDPLELRRREFVDPRHVPIVHVLVEMWRQQVPGHLSETLYSGDAGGTYVLPGSSTSHVGGVSFRDLHLAAVDWPDVPRPLEQSSRQVLSLLVPPPRRLNQLLQALDTDAAVPTVE